MACQPFTPPDCTYETGFQQTLSPLGSSTYAYTEFQLRIAGAFDIAFHWDLFDPATGTTATTPVYDSINFECTRYNPADNPGDCFFRLDPRRPAA